MQGPRRESLINRAYQVALIVSTLGLSWLGMMAVHEMGHVLHAWFSGGRVARVVLSPLEFSRTELSNNPRPLLVAWGGPVWGCLIPLAMWIAADFWHKRHAYLAAFFAGFCAIANGAYLAGGALISAGDARDLMQHGAARWHLIVLGLMAVCAGLFFWNGLGPQFGLGPSAGRVRRQDALAVSASLIAVVVAELLWSI